MELGCVHGFLYPMQWGCFPWESSSQPFGLIPCLSKGQGGEQLDRNWSGINQEQ